MNVKYYLVTLCDQTILEDRPPRFSNKLVVGLDPVEWFVLTGNQKYSVLVGFWEISESAFESFSHDEQNSAWDFYQGMQTDE